MSATNGKNPIRIALLGTVGVPARYGGFETLADNLARYHACHDRAEALAVYCTSRAYPDQPERFGKAELRYSRLSANGGSSILYDALTLRDAARRGVDVAVLLGVSGAIALPHVARRGAKIVVHVDGLEWQREKWSGLSRAFLHWSERRAVTSADAVICDSPAIAERLASDYGCTAKVIAYGGDQAVAEPDPPSPPPANLPDGYALGLCRIVPENNVAMILEAFASASQPLVFVGNWQDSEYGRGLRQSYGQHPALTLLDPIYAPGPLFALRMGARSYVHGHSAGGTNPALVEMMHVGHPIYAFDCVFNRITTDGQAIYFKSADELAAALTDSPPAGLGDRLRLIARNRYTWDRVGAEYFDFLNEVARGDAVG